jgi:hypothetical protein
VICAVEAHPETPFLRRDEVEGLHASNAKLAGESMCVHVKHLVVGCLLAVAASAAEVPVGVRDALEQLEQKAANASASRLGSIGGVHARIQQAGRSNRKTVP